MKDLKQWTGFLHLGGFTFIFAVMMGFFIVAQRIQNTAWLYGMDVSVGLAMGFSLFFKFPRCRPLITFVILLVFAVAWGWSSARFFRSGLEVPGLAYFCSTAAIVLTYILLHRIFKVRLGNEVEQNNQHSISKRAGGSAGF